MKEPPSWRTGQIIDTAPKEFNSISGGSQDTITSAAKQTTPAVNTTFCMRVVVTHFFCPFMVVVHGKRFGLAGGPLTQITFTALERLKILILFEGHMMNLFKAGLSCN
jgi:hypothetical protein